MKIDARWKIVQEIILLFPIVHATGRFPEFVIVHCRLSKVRHVYIAAIELLKHTIGCVSPSTQFWLSRRRMRPMISWFLTVRM